MEVWMRYLIIAGLLWNLWVFLIMGIDKRKAIKGKRRISERRLLLSALAFGALGGFCGMHFFHHKTLHKKFRYGLPAMLVAQVTILAYLTFLL